MLFAEPNYPLESEYWRRINMRKVAHLAGAESLHNLYNRHWPRINSIRFRHTITNYKDGVVESFAPTKEWEYLQHWLSKKFINLDEVLIREIEAVLNPSYDFIDELLEKIDFADYEKLSDQDLALIFIDVMDVPLGEIYKLNVVQIEYSLNFALHTILSQYEPNLEDRNYLLSQLIAPGELTIAQEEEISFAKIIKFARKQQLDSPYSSNEIKSRFIKHIASYAPNHCAYGELPPTEKDYLKKYTISYSGKSPLPTRSSAQKNIKDQVKASESLLAKINDDKLARLCKLMAKIGVFRDRNKAKLGETVVRRLKLLDLISKRTGESRKNLDFYLISEITELLDNGQKLSKTMIESRKKNGVRFERSEDVCNNVRVIKQQKDKNSSKFLLKGICASSGLVKGKVKIIFGKEDISKMEPGDIMVAIGTDFDLIEIMHLSAGIITEEGGLLSHASVVSRELKKPCLIGVEGATTILKDGEMVRLDALTGSLEILKK